MSKKKINKNLKIALKHISVEDCQIHYVCLC